MRPNYNAAYVPTTTRAGGRAQPATQYTRYWGPVPFVPHVHGMEMWSMERWICRSVVPCQREQPQWHRLFETSYATVGTLVRLYEEPSRCARGDWGAGQVTFQYPNTQRPSTVWYHDHALGITRLNVVAGPAGFYLIRSTNPADNPTVAGGSTAGRAPGGAAYEIPMAIQDRSFNIDGSIFYPDTRAFFDGFLGPYIGSLIPAPAPTATSRRSTTPSSSATASWSTATRGRSSTSSRGATGSGC